MLDGEENRFAADGVDLGGDVEPGGRVAYYHDLFAGERGRVAVVLGVRDDAWVSGVEVGDARDVGDVDGRIVTRRHNDGIIRGCPLFARPQRQHFHIPTLLTVSLIPPQPHINNLARKLNEMPHLLRILNQILLDVLAPRINRRRLGDGQVGEAHQPSGDIGVQELVHGRREDGRVLRERRVGRTIWFYLRDGEGLRRGWAVVPDPADLGLLFVDVDLLEGILGKEVLGGSETTGAGADDGYAGDGEGMFFVGAHGKKMRGP